MLRNQRGHRTTNPICASRARSIVEIEPFAVAGERTAARHWQGLAGCSAARAPLPAVVLRLAQRIPGGKWRTPTAR